MGWPLGVCRSAEQRRKISETLSTKSAFNNTANGKELREEHGQKMRNWYKTADGMKHKQKLSVLGRRKARPRRAENKNVYGAHAPPSPDKCTHAFHRDGLRPGVATRVVNLNEAPWLPTPCLFVSAGDDQLPILLLNLLHGDTLMFGSFVDERYLHGVPARHPYFCYSTRVSIAVTVKKTGPCIGPALPALGSGYHWIGTLALQEIIRLMLDDKYTRCTRFANVQTTRAVIVLRGEGEDFRALPTRDQAGEKVFCEEDFFAQAPWVTRIIEEIARDMGGVWSRAQVNIYPSEGLAQKMRASSSASSASSSASSASS